MQTEDIVYADFGQYSSADVRKGKVVKVSPSGQVSVDFGRKNYGDGSPIIDRFTPRGDHIGGGSVYFKARIISEGRANDLLEAHRAKAARRALEKAAENYRFSSKAEAIERAKMLLALAEALVDE